MRQKVMKPPKSKYRATRRENDARECPRRPLREVGQTPAPPENGSGLGAAAGRCLREREGGFASFFTPATSGTDRPPLDAQHASTIGSCLRSMERRSPNTSSLR